MRRTSISCFQICNQLSLLCWPPLQTTNAKVWTLHAGFLVQMLHVWPLTIQCPDGICSMFCSHIQSNMSQHPLMDPPSVLPCFYTNRINGLTQKVMTLFPLIAGMCPLRLKIHEVCSCGMWLWWVWWHPLTAQHVIAESVPRITEDVCGISNHDPLVKDDLW